MLTYQDDDFEDLLGDVAHDADAPSDAETDTIPALATESEMAQLLGITANRVRTLARDGMLHRPVRGRYDVRASLKIYIGDLRDKASRLGYAGGKHPGKSDLEAEKLRLARQQADKIEIQNAAARSELVKATDVERAWASVLRDVRAAMLAVPSRCGATLPHLTAHDVAEIDREIRAALEGLADGN
ncbi:hypothetical protein KU6B_03340 [Mameliella alba]|uniref:hypothetical protein n=1 Tax=Mameliella alba TaxID=561184 RepID=UPI0013E499F6|nr:hypothetical protein [Mameliella alba]BBU54069.1 hypothetical protein KU6B_03340 [Mameliella alba]